MDGDISTLRKRRGTCRGSITRLLTKLRDLEANPDAPGVKDSAQESATKLKSVDKEFRAIHLKVIDLIDEDDTGELDKEQDILDRHDDDVATLSTGFKHLLATPPPTAEAVATGPRKALSRKLARLQRTLDAANAALSTDSDDVALMEQYQEQLADAKKALSIADEEIVSLDLEDDDELVVLHSRLEKLHFGSAHLLRKQLNRHSTRPTTESTPDTKGAKLPKLDVPAFDGDVLHWKQFWEQFKVSVHDRSSLSNTEKLVYLQQAIKSGSAKSAIEGLSHTGDNYEEAIDSLKSRYNRPRLIHRSHVRKIVEAASLKDGSGKELRRLHDVIQQHLRALKSMGLEPDSSFITSMIELKLDPGTMFEWQKHTQDLVEDVPGCQDLIQFLDLRAQASETSLSGAQKKHNDPPNPKKSFNKGIASFHSNLDTGNRNCVLCASEQTSTLHLSEVQAHVS